jgi:putative peptidoglycan lipid II flippase
MASVCSGWLNLILLWRVLRKHGIYRPQPGWGLHTSRLAAACLAMCGLLLFGLQHWPEFSAYDAWGRMLRLAALIGGGAAVFAGVLLALGFRPRDLRASGDSGVGTGD